MNPALHFLKFRKSGSISSLEVIFGHSGVSTKVEVDEAPLIHFLLPLLFVSVGMKLLEVNLYVVRDRGSREC